MNKLADMLSNSNKIIDFFSANFGSSLVLLGFCLTVYSALQLVNNIEKLAKNGKFRRTLKSIAAVLLSVKTVEKFILELSSKQSSLNGKELSENILKVVGISVLIFVGSFVLVFLILPMGGFVWYVFIIYFMVVLLLLMIIYFIYSDKLLTAILAELPTLYSSIIEELTLTQHVVTTLTNVAKTSKPGLAYDLYLIAEAFKKDRKARSAELKRIAKKYVNNEQFLVLLTVLEQAYDKGVSKQTIDTLDEQQEIMLTKAESRKDLNSASFTFMIVLLVLPFTTMGIEQYMMTVIPQDQAADFFSSTTAILYRVGVILLCVAGELSIIYFKKSID